MMIRRPPRAPRTDTPFPTRRCSDRNGGATLAALSASADNSATYTTELAAHQPAQLRLDNIATIIERDSNEIDDLIRSEEHTSELQSLMRTSYAVFCLKKKKTISMQLHHHISLLISTNIIHTF